MSNKFLRVDAVAFGLVDCAVLLAHATHLRRQRNATMLLVEFPTMPILFCANLFRG